MTLNDPLVVALILNTNRRQDTLECLDSLLSNNYSALEVIVLDNASTDGSQEAIHSRFPSVRIEKLTENRGYTGNNNVGIQLGLKIQARWIFILNEDTVLSGNCLQELVQAGETDPCIGMVGPLVYHQDEPEIIQSAGAVMDKNWQSQHIGMNERDCGQYNQMRSVDWISGCAILVRADVFRQIGDLDERFFYYNEETDLCYRARQKGWKLVVNPNARLWHKGVNRNYNPNPSVTYYYTRNQLLFLEKNHAPIPVRIAQLGLFTRTILSWTLKPKWKSKRAHRDKMIQGILDYFRRRWGKHL